MEKTEELKKKEKREGGEMGERKQERMCNRHRRTPFWG